MILKHTGIRRFLNRLRKMFILSLAFVLIGIISVIALKHRVQVKGKPYLRTLETVAPSQAAVVFGAYVYPDGTPCLVLKDRLDRGLELYAQGVVQKLLLTGDHGQDDYDEVNAMRQYLEAKGVPPEDLFCDHAGFDTYDSLYRARDIFRAESLVLVTQSFHLNRALYIANSLGLKVQGVPSDQRKIPEIKSLELRELAANFKALLDLKRGRKPVFLGPQIPLSGSAKLSQD